MAPVDRLASLLLSAERASAEGAVTIDLFARSGGGPGGGGLTPLWDAPAPIGRLVAERGRVCWVMAKGCDATVSDLLAVETGIPSAQLEKVYQAAKKDGAPFCQTLAETGLVSPEDVRSALRRQAGAALATLAGLQAREDLAVSVARIPPLSYEERFTFAALEMLSTAVEGSAELRAQLGELPESYRRLAPHLTAAFCFLESGESDLTLVPIACGPHCEMTLGAAVELSLTALAATQPADATLAEIAPFALLPGDRGAWWLCAYQRPHLCLFQIHSRAEYLELLEALLAEARS